VNDLGFLIEPPTKYEGKDDKTDSTFTEDMMALALMIFSIKKHIGVRNQSIDDLKVAV
jgi:hypothetical protein